MHKISLNREFFPASSVTCLLFDTIHDMTSMFTVYFLSFFFFCLVKFTIFFLLFIVGAAAACQPC